jgi:hypothetical protein
MPFILITLLTNMQIKTIQKIITSKLNSWLNTITDENLVKDLRKNILVSG